MRRSATQCSCANGSKQSVCSSGKANVNPHIWKSPHYIQMKRRKNTQPKTKNRHEPEAINFFFRISLFLVCEWKAHEIRIASSNKEFLKKSQLKYAYHTKFYRMGSLMIMIRLSLLLYMFIHRRWNINNVYFSVFFTSTRRRRWWRRYCIWNINPKPIVCFRLTMENTCSTVMIEREWEENRCVIIIPHVQCRLSI